MYKGLIAHTNARTHTNTLGNDYFYPCHYFPPQMHLSEIPCSGSSCGVGLGEHGRPQQNLIDLDRPWVAIS